MSSGLSKRIAGGLMAGMGDTLVERANHKRKVALEILQSKNKQARDEAIFENRKGLVSSTQVGDDGQVYGITGGGESIDLGFRGRKSGMQMREERLSGESTTSGGEATSGLSADDDRLIKRIIEDNTSGYLDEKETDSTAVYDKLISLGRKDLADIYKSNRTEPEFDVNSDEWKDAKRTAEGMAGERKGLLKSRKTEFPETEGSETEFIEQKTRELYRDRTGKQERDAAPERASEATTVQGSGTEDDPYRPTTQEQFDQIASGEVYINPADGKIYRKN